MFLDYVKDSL